MLRYLHCSLFKCSRHIVVLSGPHIQVLDVRNGHILYTTADVAREDEVAINGGPFRCSGMSKDGRHLATTGDDKRLRIWDLETFTLLSSRDLPKKPTTIDFTRSGDILVSDKFGDVFRYTLYPKDIAEEEYLSSKHISYESPSSGELILGHASVLTSCLLTPDEKFIITADRDEHIRVSWYPEGYVIQSYCLGHNKYVSAIHIPPASPATLISGGGDHELKMWDWMTGRLQRDITVFDIAEPFIKVAPRKRRQGENNDGENVDTATTVFVVRRLNSFVSGGETHVVFSVVGATAIFEFTLAEADDQPCIRHHDFGKPVIDFTLCEEGLIWALLDADFRKEPEEIGKHPSKLVEAIRWSNGEFADAGHSEVLDSLNTLCSVPATAEDLKDLDLYSDLSSLPKNVDGELANRVSEQMESTHEPGATELHGEGTSNPAGLTKRALGRLKHKHALNLLRHEKADGNDASGPNAKKMKADESDDDV